MVQAPYLKCLGFTAFEYGILGSVFSASVACSMLVAGWLVDRSVAILGRGLDGCLMSINLY